MKKDFCINCAHPLIRNLEKGHGITGNDKACKWCARHPASRVPARRRGGK